MEHSALVRIGLIGCGRIGTAHASVLREVEGALLVAVADVEPERAATLAQEHDAQVISDPNALIDLEDIDAVVVAVPTHLHAPLTLRAAAAGKHILCEKPMAMSVEEADQMLSAVAKNRVVLMVGHDLRFSRHYREAKAAVASGRIGRPLALTAERLSGASDTSWRQWIRRRGEGLGAFDALIHDLDVALWILGPVSAVSAGGVRGAGGTWDHVQVLLKHTNACTSTIEASLMVPPSFPFSSCLRLVGEDGTLVRRFVGGRSFRDAGMDSGLILYIDDAPPQVLVPPSPDHQEAIRQELMTFVQAVRTGRLPDEALPDEARAAQALAARVETALGP